MPKRTNRILRVNVFGSAPPPKADPGVTVSTEGSPVFLDERTYCPDPALVAALFGLILSKKG